MQKPLHHEHHVFSDQELNPPPQKANRSPLGPGRDFRFTIRERKERELNPQGTFQKCSTGFQPVPVANRVALPLSHQCLDQDLNHQPARAAPRQFAQGDSPSTWDYRSRPSSSLSVGGLLCFHVRSGT